MQSKETNELLRSVVHQLIAKGWNKTLIGKALLGDNGQGHVAHWLNIEGNKTNDFGLKPLTNIAGQINCEVHVVFLPKDGDTKEIKETLDEYNQSFANDLKEKVANYLGNRVTVPKFIKSSRGKIDKAIDDILSGRPPKDPTKEGEKENSEDVEES